MNKEEEAILKLLNVFNYAIDKATSPEALTLVNNYLLYIRLESIFFLLCTVVMYTLTFYSIKNYKYYNNKSKSYPYTNDGDAFIFFGFSCIAIIISFICTMVVPKNMILIADPRLYFVFKVIG